MKPQSRPGTPGPKSTPKSTPSKPASAGKAAFSDDNKAWLKQSPGPAPKSAGKSASKPAAAVKVVKTPPPKAQPKPTGPRGSGKPQRVGVSPVHRVSASSAAPPDSDDEGDDDDEFEDEEMDVMRSGELAGSTQTCANNNQASMQAFCEGEMLGSNSAPVT